MLEKGISRECERNIKSEKVRKRKRARERERVDYARALQKDKQSSFSMHTIRHLALQASRSDDRINAMQN